MNKDAREQKVKSSLGMRENNSIATIEISEERLNQEQAKDRTPFRPSEKSQQSIQDENVNIHFLPSIAAMNEH